MDRPTLALERLREAWPVFVDHSLRLGTGHLIHAILLRCSGVSLELSCVDLTDGYSPQPRVRKRFRSSALKTSAHPSQSTFSTP